LIVVDWHERHEILSTNLDKPMCMSRCDIHSLEETNVLLVACPNGKQVSDAVRSRKAMVGVLSANPSH
jgi:hypothetical protein